jgi:ATP-dependent Clp protease ATP-binding subunit ClpA
VLESIGITLEEVRAQVARIVGRGDEPPSGQVPFTPRAKKVLELALREALSLGHNWIGTEHLLLGLVRENEGVAARILLGLEADPERVWNEVIRTLGGNPVLHPRPVPMPKGRCRSRLPADARLLALGWLLFAVALGLGILIGWAIWGA